MSAKEPKQHYLPRLYLKRFSINPNTKNKAYWKILSLDHHQTIRKHLIDNVCVIPKYNTCEQDKRLQKLEKTVFAPAFNNLDLQCCLNRTIDEKTLMGLLKFASYSFAGSPFTRYFVKRSLEKHLLDSGVKKIDPFDTQNVTGMFDMTDQIARQFLLAIAPWQIVISEIKNGHFIITNDRPPLIKNNGKGDLFRIDLTEIEYKHITYTTKQGDFIGDPLFSKFRIESVNFDYPTFICLPLSPKRVMFLYSDTKEIPMFDPNNEEMIRDLNIQIHADSMMYTFSNIESALTDIWHLIKWK